MLTEENFGKKFGEACGKNGEIAFHAVLHVIPADVIVLVGIRGSPPKRRMVSGV